MPKGQTLCSVTPMVKGGFRGECLIEGCGWWHDSLYSDLAGSALRQHMKSDHGVKNVTTLPLD